MHRREPLEEWMDGCMLSSNGHGPWTWVGGWLLGIIKPMVTLDGAHAKGVGKAHEKHT